MFLCLSIKYYFFILLLTHFVKIEGFFVIFNTILFIISKIKLLKSDKSKFQVTSWQDLQHFELYLGRY
jgi:hypothetical protein